MAAVPESWNAPQVGACRHCVYMRKNASGDVLLCSFASYARCEEERELTGGCGPEAKHMRPVWEVKLCEK